MAESEKLSWGQCAFFLVLAWVFGHIGLLLPFGVLTLLHETYGTPVFHDLIYPHLFAGFRHLKPLGWLLALVNPLLGVVVAFLFVLPFFALFEWLEGTGPESSAQSPSPKKTGTRTTSKEDAPRASGAATHAASAELTPEEGRQLLTIRSFLADPDTNAQTFEYGITALGLQKTAQSPNGGIYETECSELAFEWEPSTLHIVRVGFTARSSGRRLLLMEGGELLG